jgi:hypothetical protein
MDRCASGSQPIAWAMAADRTLGIPPAIYFLGDSKIADRASANLNQAMRALDSAGRVARPVP